MASPHRRIPLWVHQIVAYVAGAAMVGVGIHAPSADAPFLLAGAALVVLPALVAKGPAGPFRLLGYRSLRLAEVVVGGVLAVLPFFQAGGPRIEVVVTLWVAAIALVRLAVFRGSPARIEAEAPAPPTTAPTPPSVLDVAVRQAGRRTGEAGRRARDLGEQAQHGLLRGARTLGRAAGRRQARRQADDTD